MTSIKPSKLKIAQGQSVQLRIRSRFHALRIRPCALIDDIVEAVKTGARSAEDVTSEYLKRIEEEDERLGCFLQVNAERALEQARKVDETRAKQGESALGFLAGVPIAIKDNICTRNEKTTAASRILEDFLPPYDATCVERLKKADAIILGKTNMDEFGMGSSTENSAYRPTLNPVNEDYVPGGSSGGSAAAVASGECAAALGSDTGGSIRLPASFCGITGLKPTNGLVSRYGLIAYASSLETVGPMALSVKDVAYITAAIAGRDVKDATSYESPENSNDCLFSLPDAADLNSKPLAGLKIGVIENTVGEGVQQEVKDAIVKASANLISSLGAEVLPVSMKSFSQGLPAYYEVACAEASSNLARFDGMRYGLFCRSENSNLNEAYMATRNSGFGQEVKSRLLLGTYALSSGYYDAYYKRAQKVRTLIQEDFKSCFRQVDLLICPVAPTTAYKRGALLSSPLEMYLGDIMTVNINLAGVPALSVPCGFDHNGLPIGLQVIAPAFAERLLLRTGHIFQLMRS